MFQFLHSTYKSLHYQNPTFIVPKCSWVHVAHQADPSYQIYPPFFTAVHSCLLVKERKNWFLKNKISENSIHREIESIIYLLNNSLKKWIDWGLQWKVWMLYTPVNVTKIKYVTLARQRLSYHEWHALENALSSTCCVMPFSRIPPWIHRLRWKMRSL